MFTTVNFVNIYRTTTVT